MPMYKRGYEDDGDKYRFGFNGKEKDDEVHGASGTCYDYGFRIYDPRIAKFLSVDPLTKKFPFYTPYQFAGNKPIWAIDLDGLEEYLYTYMLRKDKPALLVSTEINVKEGTTLDFITKTTNTVLYNKKTGEKFNLAETGTYQIEYIDESGNSVNLHRNYQGKYIEGAGDIMPLGQNNRAGNIYPGKSNPKIEVDDVLTDDYRREALNEVDLGGMKHDLNYDTKDAVGVKAAFLDKNVRPFDEQLINACKEVQRKYNAKENDIVTGKPVTEAMNNEAGKIVAAFKFMSVVKTIVGSKKINYE